jgi:hypothetical protein
MEIPEFSIILDEISKIKNMVAVEKAVNDYESKFTAEWYNDQKCWELKGGMSLSTYRSNRFYQCKGGVPDAKVGGRNVWSRASVMEWAKLSDDELPAYHEKYKTGAKKR